jgi:hypothetical protein
MTYAVIPRNDDHHLCVSMICKNATQSILTSAKLKNVSREKALLYKYRLGIIRHPIERVKAGYSFYCRLRDEEVDSSVVPVESLESYEKYVDYILTHWDPHWVSQLWFLELEDKTFIPTHMIRFEELAQWWPQISDKELPHKNSAPEQETSDYRLNHLYEHYRRDLALWHKTRKYNDEATLLDA